MYLLRENSECVRTIAYDYVHIPTSLRMYTYVHNRLPSRSDSSALRGHTTPSETKSNFQSIIDFFQV